MTVGCRSVEAANAASSSAAAVRSPALPAGAGRGRKPQRIV